MANETSSSSRFRSAVGIALKSRLAANAAIATTAFALWTSPAKASPAYAYVLSSAFDFSGGCPACHTSQAGGLGTVTKPFGKTLMGLGLRANDTGTLYEALTELETAMKDSDGDTIADFDELAPGGDPNDASVAPDGATPIPGATPSPAPAPAPAPTPSPAPAAAGKDDGGCSLSTSGGSGLPGLAVAIFGLALAGRRRRR